MAKTCSVCKKTYPDDMASCPHCAAESLDFTATGGEGQEEHSPVVRLREPGSSIEEPMTTSDSDIDLAESLNAVGDDPAQGPASGTSDVAWSALVEDVGTQPADEAPASAKFDAPSDKDLIERASRQPARPAPPQEADEIVIFDDGSGTRPGTGGPSDSGTVLADFTPPSEASLPEMEPPADLAKTTPRPPSDIQIDSPSDADMLRYADAGPPGTSDTSSSADIDVPPDLSNPPSGSSMVRWDSLVDEATQGSGVLSDLKFDSPSDASMLKRLREEEARKRSEEGERGPRQAGEIDLADEGFDEDSSSDVDLGTDSDPRDAPGRRGRPPESVVVGPEGGAPGTDEVSDSGSDPDIFPLEGTSTVNLGEAPTSGERPSGRDLIAEAVESGVDLEQLAAAAASGTHAGPAPEAAAEVDSSSVDLGAAFGTGSSGDRGAPSSGSVAAELLGTDSGVHAPPRGRPRREEDSGPDSSAVNLGEVGAVGSSSSVSGPEAEEEEEAAPTVKGRAAAAKPVKPRSGPSWLGGGLVGALAGAGACVGLWFAGLWLPGEWRGDPKPPAPSAPLVGPGPQQQPPAGVPAALAAMKAGDFEQALNAVKGDSEEPAHLAARGEARWLHHVLQQRKESKPLQADDDAIKQAVDDLKKANNADALFWLAHIQEMTGQADDARKTYEEGVKRFENEPATRRRFQAALDRLDALAPEKAAGAALPLPPTDQRQALALLLLALQAPADGQEPDEAGYEFWAAVRLAQQGKYADAAKALEKARALHDRERYSRLRKAQNPLSDPTEEIFLKACDELKTYWLVREQLREKGYFSPKNRDLTKALQAVPPVAEVAALQGLKGAADKLQKEKEAAEKKATEQEALAKAAQKNADGLAKAVETGQKTTTELENKFKSAADLVKAAEGRLKAVTDRLEAAGVKPDDPAKAVDQLAAARKSADAALEGVLKQLKDAKYLPANATSAEAAKGVETVINVASAKDPGGQLSRAVAEAKRYQEQLNQRRSPQEMLDVWTALLQDRGRKELAGAAGADAERVSRDAGATPEVKAKALYVQGLALRNQGKFDEARAVLGQAVKGAGDSWHDQVRTALRELTDPAAYYLPRAERAFLAGQEAHGMQALDEAIQAFPKDSGKVLAMRSLLRLDAARAKGRLAANQPEVIAAGKDAQDAIRAGAVAEGHYAEGRLAEELGNLADAQRNYRQALAVAKDANADRIKLALARVLVRMGQPAGERVGRLPTTPAEMLVSLITLAAQAGPPVTADEAQRLADEVLAGKDGPDSFLLKSQALAIKGLWTKALMTYVEGLRPHVRREYADVLAELVKNHPALSRPESLAVANPLAAEQHYAAGLGHFNARNYPAAEKEFLAAVEGDSQDARYHYYLGLSRLLSGKRGEAFEDFEQGARLEQQGRPSRRVVNGALERVQGSQREAINRFRP